MEEHAVIVDFGRRRGNYPQIIFIENRLTSIFLFLALQIGSCSGCNAVMPLRVFLSF